MDTGVLDYYGYKGSDERAVTGAILAFGIVRAAVSQKSFQFSVASIPETRRPRKQLNAFLLMRAVLCRSRSQIRVQDRIITRPRNGWIETNEEHRGDMEAVYLAIHEYSVKEEDGELNDIVHLGGVCSSEGGALSLVERLSALPGFDGVIPGATEVAGITVNEYPLDEVFWSEGFV